MTTTLEAPRRSANALPDDPDWCGHPMVDLSCWRCHACGRPVTDATRRRLEQRPTKAPPGSVWVLTSGPGWAYEEDYAGGDVVGVFSDRRWIVFLLVRRHIIDAAALRAKLALLTWYQSAYNPDYLEAWGVDSEGDEVNYGLHLHTVDQP